MMQLEVKINPDIAYYKSGADIIITKVTTASSNSEDMLRGYMIDAIYRIQNLRKTLRQQHPELLPYAS